MSKNDLLRHHLGYYRTDTPQEAKPTDLPSIEKADWYHMVKASSSWALLRGDTGATKD